MPQPRWDDIQLLLVVARTGSALAAATALGISQSTVSRRMATLETTLDARLFDRRGRRLEPTADARELIAVAERLDHDVDEVVSRLRSRDRQLTGPVTISSLKPIMSAVLPCLVALRRDHPGLQLVLETNFSLSKLHRKEADVVMRVSSAPPETLVGRRVAKFAYGLYRRIGSATPDELIAYPPPRGDIAASPWLHQLLPKASVSMQIGDDELQLDAVRRGFAAAQLLCMQADLDPLLERVPGAPIEWGEDLWVLMHESLREMPRVRLVFDAVADALTNKRELIEGRWPVNGTVNGTGNGDSA